MTKADTRRLLLSIHDVTPATFSAVERLHAHVSRHAGVESMALLVVPEHWNSIAVAQDPAFKGWLRTRHDAGDEIILHGWHHRGEPGAGDWLTRFKGSRLTAGEGEFLTLGEAEAARRMRDGRSLLEDIIGAPVPGFIAPAWLYGEGARQALARVGFSFAEDHVRLWRPVDGSIAARGPVITWASRSRPRLISSLAFAAAARSALGWLPVVRIGVHPGDAGEPAIMDSIAATVRRFRQSHRPARYAEVADGSLTHASACLAPGPVMKGS